ncbi:MAG: hypothetical protein ACTS5I_16625 [Rhodanobacter sp.]
MKKRYRTTLLKLARMLDRSATALRRHEKRLIPKRAKAGKPA